jgi:hypothetical protein
MRDKKKIIWFLVFIALVVLTLYTMLHQNKSFSVGGFIEFVSTASWQWLLLAFLGMFGFVLFEGMALVVLCRALGYKKRMSRGLIYSAPDIYFSAITPSATGGQPASAYFMMRDKIPGAVTTIALLINLTLYTTSIILIGVICFVTRPEFLMNFSILSKCMIAVGFIIQFVLLTVFLLLVYKEKIIMKIAAVLMKVLSKLHLMHNIDEKLLHLKLVEKQYKECARTIKNHKKPLAVAFVFNFLQRASLIMVSVCVFMAKGGELSKAYDVFVTQGYVVLGSNSVPIPGAVGAADYLFIDGFHNIVADPVSIELLSRGISFYSCIMICGIITFAAYVVEGLKGMKRKRK